MSCWIVFAFSLYIPGIITNGNILDLQRVSFVEMGKKINISCNVGKNRNNVQFYKENEDGGLDAVSRSTCHSSNKESRYHFYCENTSVDTMEIRDVLTSDSGVYYCSSSGLDPTFHLASTLIVTDDLSRTPSMLILSSVDDHPKNSASIVLLCVALNWTEKWDFIKWTVNGTEEEGWTTLDPDGSLRSLFVISKSHQSTDITCYIKELSSNEMISEITRVPALEKDKNYDCFMILYVGIPIIITIILIHQIILQCKLRSSSKNTPGPETHQERRVRFSPQDESVTYAAVKS